MPILSQRPPTKSQILAPSKRVHLVNLALAVGGQIIGYAAQSIAVRHFLIPIPGRGSQPPRLTGAGTTEELAQIIQILRAPVNVLRVRSAVILSTSQKEAH